MFVIMWRGQPMARNMRPAGVRGLSRIRRDLDPLAKLSDKMPDMGKAAFYGKSRVYGVVVERRHVIDLFDNGWIEFDVLTPKLTVVTFAWSLPVGEVEAADRGGWCV